MSLTRRFLGVTNARLRARRGLWDVEIVEGRIGRIRRGSGRGQNGFLDAKGGLVTEPFTVAHVHLDKVMTASRLTSDAVAAYQLGRMDTRKSIRLASKVKEGYSVSEILSRTKPLVAGALENGVTAMRAFADTDTVSELKAVRALMGLRQEFAGKMVIQVVAFPQEGIVADPGAEEFVEKAVEIGADVVGGIPWLEEDRAKQKRHIDKMFAIAKRHKKPIAMLVDDSGDPRLRTLEMLALKTVNERMMGQVQACHARAMEVYPEAYAQAVARLCKRARIGVVSSPHTGPLHARIDVLRKFGVTVALGQDDCSDAYYPFGRCNMLEVAFLAAHLLREMTAAEMERLYDMITINPRKIIGLGEGKIYEGSPADLVVLLESDVASALAVHGKAAMLVVGGIPVSGKETRSR